MSVESSVIASVVETGKPALRRLYSAGISREDFVSYEDEFAWIEQRAIERKIINKRTFKRKFPDFDFLSPDESLRDLIPELKSERAFTEVNNVIANLAERLEYENALELADEARERLSQITKLHAPQSQERLSGDVAQQIKEMRQGFLLAKQGVPPGIPIEIPHLDHHWGGWVRGRMYVILGRPGEGKSFIVGKGAWTSMKNGYKVGLFSPEMSAHEHRCRIHTLASAEKWLQEEVGLKKSFRNRALDTRRGFNIKQYERFLEYLDQMEGEIHLLTGTHRKQRMTVAYIEQQIEALNLDIVFIDPIYKLKTVRRRGAQWEELGDLSDSVQDLAEAYNIPVVITNQAHRQGGAKDDAPHKDRSFGSDVPIQNADYTLGVKNLSEEHRLICRCTKSRFGQDFRFEMRFFPNTGVMQPITTPDGSYMNGSDNPDEDELREMMKEVAGVDN